MSSSFKLQLQSSSKFKHYNHRVGVRASDYEDDAGYFGLPTVPGPELFDSFALDDDIKCVTGKKDLEKSRAVMEKQILIANDHLYNEEIEHIFMKLWSEGEEGKEVDPELKNTKCKLAELCKMAEQIENVARKRDSRLGFEDLSDEMRVIRSRIRMYCNSPNLMPPTKPMDFSPMGLIKTIGNIFNGNNGDGK